MRIFYHGTNEEWLPEIAKTGLRKPCLATTPELAACYAEAADGEGEQVVLGVALPDDAGLDVDWKSMGEPVGFGGKTSKSLDYAVRELLLHKSDVSWWETSAITGAVLSKTDIPPERLWVESGAGENLFGSSAMAVGLATSLTGRSQQANPANNPAKLRDSVV